MHEDTWYAAIYSDQFRANLLNPLLHGPVEAFNLWNVLVPDGCVQLNIHVSECCSGRFKLPIFSQFYYLETPICIVGLDGIHVLHIQISLQVLLS